MAVPLTCLSLAILVMCKEVSLLDYDENLDVLFVSKSSKMASSHCQVLVAEGDSW